MLDYLILKVDLLGLYSRDSNIYYGKGALTAVRDLTYHLMAAKGTANDDLNGQVYFDASLFNSIYGKSDTVQSASVTVRRLIKAA